MIGFCKPPTGFVVVIAEVVTPANFSERGERIRSADENGGGGRCLIFRKDLRGTPRSDVWAI